MPRRRRASEDQGGDGGGSEFDDLDGPARRLRSRFSLEAMGKGNAEGGNVQTEDDASTASILATASSLSLRDKDAFDDTYSEEGSDELGHASVKDRKARCTYGLDVIWGRNASSFPLTPMPSPPSSYHASSAFIEAPAKLSSGSSQRTLRDWLTPPPTQATLSHAVPNIVQHFQEGDRIPGHEARRIDREAMPTGQPTRHHTTVKYILTKDKYGITRRVESSPPLQFYSSNASSRPSGADDDDDRNRREPTPTDSAVGDDYYPPPRRSYDEDERPTRPHRDDDDDDDGDDDDSDPGSNEEVTTPLTTFHPFIRLPCEIREKIYEFALSAPHPILPHLCDFNHSTQAHYGSPRFHDLNQPDRHNAVHSLLGVTQVSKAIRDESLPVFYAINVFFIGKDTSSYFDRLAHLGYFHLVRQVQFHIVHRLKKRAPETLRGLSSFLKQKAMYEAALRREAQSTGTGMTATVWDGKGKGKGLAVPAPKPIAELVGESHRSLTQHPQYQVGGLADLNVLICLGKLCTAAPFTSAGPSQEPPPGPPTTSANPSLLTIPIPYADLFTIYPSLSWFPMVAAGLGISLRFVQDVPVDDSTSDWITMTWRQRWGKKKTLPKNTARGHSTSNLTPDATNSGVDCNTAATTTWDEGIRLGAHEVKRRALELNPRLEEEQRSRLNAYYRIGCKGVLTWFDVPTEPRGGAEEDGVAGGEGEVDAVAEEEDLEFTDAAETQYHNSSAYPYQ